MLRGRPPQTAAPPPPPPTKGTFVPTFIAFQGKSAADQAREILLKAKKYLAMGYTKIGITYSANNDQVVNQINPIYQALDNNPNNLNPIWKTGVKGSNQAAVMKEIEKLLATPDFAPLQGKFRILPITTCAKRGGKGLVQQAWLDRDIKSIKTFLGHHNKGVVLAWQNETANEKKKKKFAIGGSVSDQLTKTQVADPTNHAAQITQDKWVQIKLEGLRNRYPAVTPPKEPPKYKGPTAKKHYFSGRKVLGALIGGLAGGFIGAIPLFLVLGGAILVPATFGGSALLIGIGLAMFAGLGLGGFIGAKVGEKLYEAHDYKNWQATHVNIGQQMQQNPGRQRRNPRPPGNRPPPPGSQPGTPVPGSRHGSPPPSPPRSPHGSREASDNESENSAENSPNNPRRSGNNSDESSPNSSPERRRRNS